MVDMRQQLIKTRIKLADEKVGIDPWYMTKANQEYRDDYSMMATDGVDEKGIPFLCLIERTFWKTGSTFKAEKGIIFRYQKDINNHPTRWIGNFGKPRQQRVAKYTLISQ